MVYNPLWSVERQPKFLLATCFIFISCSSYSSTMKAEVTCSSEISVDCQQATRRYIPEDRTLRLPLCSESIYDSSFSSPLSVTKSCMKRYTFVYPVMTSVQFLGANCRGAKGSRCSTRWKLLKEQSDSKRRRKVSESKGLSKLEQTG
jgi:hypothetical protein